MTSQFYFRRLAYQTMKQFWFHLLTPLLHRLAIMFHCVRELEATMVELCFAKRPVRAPGRPRVDIGA